MGNTSPVPMKVDPLELMVRVPQLAAAGNETELVKALKAAIRSDVGLYNRFTLGREVHRERERLEIAASVLFPDPTLSRMAKDGFFDQAYNYLGIGLDIGRGDSTLNFRLGLKQLYDEKIEWMKEHGYGQGTMERLRTSKNRANREIYSERAERMAQVVAKRAESQEYIFTQSPRMNLEQYAQECLGRNLGLMIDIYRGKNKIAEGDGALASERKQFRRGMAKLLNERVMLSYSVQELMPGGYNALARIYFFEKFLSSGGTDYIKYFPAIFDDQLSYGPFQLTPVAVEEIGRNFAPIYGFPNLPRTLSERWSITDHAEAAVALALRNMDIASIKIGNRNPRALARLNDMLEELSKSPEGTEKLQAFATGLIAAMHYRQADAVDALVAFATVPERTWAHYKQDPERNFMLHLPNGSRNRVQDYYRNSVEVYLTLKDYAALRDRYSGQNYSGRVAEERGALAARF